MEETMEKASTTTATANAALAPTTTMRNHNGTAMLDDHGRVVYRSQFLATHPLRGDCKERSQGGGGGGGKKVLTYLTGDSVIRTMNAVFGHDGWTTSITRERQVDCVFNNKKGKWVVGYVATVKITLLQSGASHEDCGCGEGMNESKLKALDTAMKSAITDAMKRAARHFGERLGNALYVPGNGTHRAPLDNKMALRDLERQEARDWFGNQQTLYELRASKTQQQAAAANDEAHRHEQQQSSSEKQKGTRSHSSGEHETAISNHQHVQNDTALPALQRQTTPPLLASSTGRHEQKEKSPPHQHQPPQQQQLGHGFTRASELGNATMVTPPSGQGQASSPQQQHVRTTYACSGSSTSRNSSPHHTTTASPTTASKTASAPSPSPPPPLPHYNTPLAPLTQQSPAYNNNSNKRGNQTDAQQATPTSKRQKIVHNPYQH